jgi:hypothetical protein
MYVRAAAGWAQIANRFMDLNAGFTCHFSSSFREKGVGELFSFLNPKSKGHIVRTVGLFHSNPHEYFAATTFFPADIPTLKAIQYLCFRANIFIDK